MKRRNSKWSHVAVLTAGLWSLGTGIATAQEAPKPDNEVSYNLSVTTDYRYRGISQSRLDPALQGGADYTNNPTGLYLGTWLSTIKWIKDVGGDSNIEWDIYGGKRGSITSDVTYDVGGLYYVYPGNGLGPNANTFEIYGQLGYGPAYVKYSHSLTNLFGTANSKGSGYLDIGANLDVGSGFTLNLHVGHQDVKHNGAYSYTDYKAGVTKDLGVASVALAFIKADTPTFFGSVPKNMAKSGLVLSVTKTF
jgi:uncharacterized protein (TIGR02001 family)